MVYFKVKCMLQIHYMVLNITGRTLKFEVVCWKPPVVLYLLKFMGFLVETLAASEASEDMA